MNLQAVYHNPKSNYAYAKSEHELHIRLRTAKSDVEKVYVNVGVKFKWGNINRYEMKKVATDRLFDYYQYNLIAHDTRLGYYFEICDKESSLVYCESGFTETFDNNNAYLSYFQYPFINKTDVHKVPNWVGKTVFYQIFVERFCNGNKLNSPKNVSKWDENPTYYSFSGGDIQGIMDKLDYLSDLGINGIYLTPIFESSSNHKYNTTDYLKVDKNFGTNEIFFEFVNKAHEKGIKIVLDGVFNHSGHLFSQFQDVVKNGEKSIYKDWFFIEKYADNQDDMKYQTFSTSKFMPKLNTANPEVKKYLLDAVAYWTREGKIDGWRLDVSDEIDMDFWIDFRKTVHEINEDIYIIGENWHNSYPWLTGNRFDSVMNYSVTKCCIEYFATKSINAQEFMADLSHVLMWNTEQVNLALLNILDSHDTSRFLSICNGNKDILKLAVLFQYSYIGVPCTYYGTEIGMEGGKDPDCRRTFNWNEDCWDNDLLNFFKKLIKIRTTSDCLSNGIISLYSKDNVAYIERSFENQKTITVINNTDSVKTIELPKYAIPLLDENKVSCNCTYELKAYTGDIFIDVK